VKLDQFKLLCDREWRQERRGDVTTLNLTAASLAELETDLIVNPDDRCHSVLDPFALVNPVTRSPVKVTGGSIGIDMMEVRYAVPYGVLKDTDTIPA
jgi:hypothetical protein